MLRVWTAVMTGLATVVVALPAAAQSLGFQPQRVVMDAKTVNAALTLTNKSDKAGSYRVELIDMIYRDDGSVVPAQITPPGYPSAKSLIRFSPSQIRLDAGETQTVRVLIKGADTLATGEYRVHAVLRQLPEVQSPKAPRNPAVLAGVIGIESSVAIPVIIRRGTTNATGSIASAKIATGKTPGLDLQLSRNGNRSLYTTLLLKNVGGKIAAEIKGVAVPVPNAQRRFLWPLDAKLAGALNGGGYTVEMVDHDTLAVIDTKTVR